MSPRYAWIRGEALPIRGEPRFAVEQHSRIFHSRCSEISRSRSVGKDGAGSSLSARRQREWHALGRRPSDARNDTHDHVGNERQNDLSLPPRDGGFGVH